MNGRNVVIMVLVLFIVGLAELGFVFWRIWNNKTQTAKVEAPIETVAIIQKEPEKSSVIKREDLTEALIVELKKNKGEERYRKFEVYTSKENSRWIWGNVLAYLTNDVNQLPPDAYGFLAKKDTEGNIIKFGYMYREVFEELLTEVDEEIIPEAHKKYLSPNY